MFLTGYAIGEDVGRLAEPADGPGAAAVAEIAARHGARRRSTATPSGTATRIYNSAQLIGPDGARLAGLPQDAPLRRLRARLVHPGRAARRPGRTRRPAVGLMICYDVEFPENVRAHALAGTDLLLVPTALMHPFEFVAAVRRAGPRLREPDVRRVRQPDRPGRRVRVRRAQLPGRPGRRGPGPGRPRRGTAPRRRRPRAAERLPRGQPVSAATAAPGCTADARAHRAPPPLPAPPYPQGAVPHDVHGAHRRPAHRACRPAARGRRSPCSGRTSPTPTTTSSRTRRASARYRRPSTAPRSPSSAAGCPGIVTAYELMKMGLQAGGVRGRPDRRPAAHRRLRGLRPRADRRDGRDALPALLHRAPALHRPGGPARPGPSPTRLPRHPFDRRRPQGRVATTRGPLDDLPEVYREVMEAWNACLEEGADFSDMNRRHARRATCRASGRSGRGWSRSSTTRPSTASSATRPAFASFRHREIFGQVGFGTGGWDTDFPNSILEILRVVYTEADDHHRGIVGGSQQLPLRLWEREPERSRTGRAGTSLRLAARRRAAPGRDPAAPHGGRTGSPSPTPPATSAPTGPRSSPRRAGCCCPRSPATTRCFPIDHWTAMERTHYMESSKLFVPVDRPFWLRQRDAGATGRDVMSMTLTDRMTRGTYLLDDGPDKPAVICLSYTWCDDSLKWLPLSADERMEVMLRSLGEIYPGGRHPPAHHRQPGDRVLGERAVLHGRVQGQPARPLPLPAAAVHALHAGRAARGQARHLPRRATTSPGRRAGPRAPCRPRSTRSGA